MGKVLTILEVSQKQSYIFASKKLRENAERSQDIADITDSGFFSRAAGDAYRKEDNLVNTGGGHATLQFDSREAAVEFTRRVTLAALETYPQLELFATTIDYDPNQAPGENIKRLTGALEKKKARRISSFRRLNFGVEQPREEDARPERTHFPDSELPKPPAGHKWFTQPEQEFEDNFLAVVHIDGNNMGARVDRLYEEHKDWDDCREALQAFSDKIKKDFESAFTQMAKNLANQSTWKDQKLLPLRPIILAGDDVCFVTAGSIGLECARVFIEKLAAISDPAGGMPYAACAGVALVHQKYPFHRAYDLAEALCGNAKKYGAELDEARRVSAMDWHIEFGQLKDNLTELRQDYETEDGCRLELRPVTVVLPAGGCDGKVSPVPQRSYAFFRSMSQEIKDSCGRIARSKIKELRAALKQGEIESRFFLRDKEIGELLYHPLEAAYAQAEWAEKLPSKAAFQLFPPDSKRQEDKHCLFFDSIEMIDHFTPFEEVDV